MLSGVGDLPYGFKLSGVFIVATPRPFVATDGREEVRTLLIAALGCNLAWGLVDAVMHLVATKTQKRRSHALVTSRVVRVMRDQPLDEDGCRGSILLLGSVLATHPVPEYFATHAYAAAKGGLISLMTALAATYAADRIRVNLLAPGLTDTPMAARATGDLATVEYAARKQPLIGALLDPSDVAEAALFFLSPESRAVTGQALAVDGGWSVVSTSATAGDAAEPSA